MTDYRRTLEYRKYYSFWHKHVLFSLSGCDKDDGLAMMYHPFSVQTGNERKNNISEENTGKYSNDRVICFCGSKDARWR